MADDDEQLRVRVAWLYFMEGLTQADIASKLGISYTTVRTHIRSLGSKLGVHSKLQAIVKARELALVE